MKYIIIILIISILLLIYNNYKTKKSIINQNNISDNNNNIIENNELKSEYLPYHKKYLLTKYEWHFFKELKPITDKLNYHILAKIRIADLIDVDDNLDNSTHQKYLNKIISKHIDFALCNPDDFKIKLLIELDDSSHDKADVIKRDIFLESVCEKTEYKLLRVNNANNIEEKILNILNNSNINT